MEIVDNGDKSGLIGVRNTRTVGCVHCRGAEAHWDGTENPPQLVYNRFPPDGVVILSLNTIVVCCRQCWQMGWSPEVLKLL